MKNHAEYTAACGGDQCIPCLGVDKGGHGKSPLIHRGACCYNTCMVIRRSSHGVYDTEYHLVCCPKYRKDLFEQSYLRERANGLFYEVAEEYVFIIEMEVANDHVYIFISFPPRYSISRVVGIMKSFIARVLFKEFPSIKERLWNKELWEDGYFARTEGDKLTKDIIKKYIKHHQNQKQAPVQLDFELDH